MEHTTCKLNIFPQGSEKRSILGFSAENKEGEAQIVAAVTGLETLNSGACGEEKSKIGLKAALRVEGVKVR